MKNITNITQFLREVKLELSRVEWPTRTEFIGSVIVVLIVVCVFAIFLGMVDKGFGLLVKHIFAHIS